MATEAELMAAGVDALALSRFLTEPSGTQNLNSEGNDVGTLADGYAQMAPIFEDVAALLSDTRAHQPGTFLRTAQPEATYKVVEAPSVGHLTTAGGVSLWHVDGPYVIAITGQSNASGVWPGGPDPASPLVRTWDSLATAWGGSSQNVAPWTHSNPNGNLGNSNYALARAHYLADQTGRPIFIIFDAVGGTAISAWTADAPADVRFQSLDAKMQAAFADPLLAQHGLTHIDEMIFAQGEANFEDDFETYLAELRTLNNKLRATTWMGFRTPCYMMAPTNLHDRYAWRDAMKFHCGYDDNADIFVSNNGLLTEYQMTGSGDNSHFLGDSVWRGGYDHIARASATEIDPTLLWARGAGPAGPTDQTVLCTFSSIVSHGSWTVATPPNGPAATGSISWGNACVADGNYTAAFGFECSTDNVANYGLVAGRSVSALSGADYFGGFGFQNTMDASYTFTAGRGHSVVDEGGSAFGLFSEYTAPETDEVMLQVGTGASSSTRKNALTVRKSGGIEAKHLPVHADGAAATAAGLVAGAIYATPDGALRVVV